MKHGVCSAFWLPPIPHRQKHGYSITRWWTRYTACILKHNKGSWSIRLCHLVSLTGWQLCACVWCKLSSGADRRRRPLSCNPEPLLFNESLWAAGNTQIVCWDSCAPRFLSQSLCVCVCGSDVQYGCRYLHKCKCVPYEDWWLVLSTVDNVSSWLDDCRKQMNITQPSFLPSMSTSSAFHLSFLSYLIAFLCMCVCWTDFANTGISQLCHSRIQSQKFHIKSHKS